jgi:hypothetical protein
VPDGGARNAPEPSALASPARTTGRSGNVGSQPSIHHEPCWPGSRFRAVMTMPQRCGSSPSPPATSTVPLLPGGTAAVPTAPAVRNAPRTRIAKASRPGLSRRSDGGKTNRRRGGVMGVRWCRVWFGSMIAHPTGRLLHKTGVRSQQKNAGRPSDVDKRAAACRCRGGARCRPESNCDGTQLGRPGGVGHVVTTCAHRPGRASGLVSEVIHADQRRPTRPGHLCGDP